MQNRLNARTLFVMALLLMFILSSTVVIADDNVTYQGNKARITVGKIKTKASKCPRDIAEAIGEMISTSLANNEKFIVLANQEEVEELIDEIELGQSGYVEEGRGPDKGLMEGADLLITGAVTAFEPNAGGSSGGLGGLKKKAFGKIGINKKNAEIQIDIKIIDIRTRRIIKAKTIKAKSSKWKTSMTGGGWVEDVALVGGLGVYSNKPMENAIRTALAKTLEMVSKEIPDEYYRYKGKGQYSKEYGSQGSSAGEQTNVSNVTSNTSSSASTAEDMTLFTKYDFVPGNKVIFFDDMKDEEEGEFPYRWNLDKGVYEVVRLGKECWIMCSDNGKVRPKIADAPPPLKYTVELEFYENGPDQLGAYFYIHWIDRKGKSIGYLALSNSNATKIRILKKDVARKKLSSDLTKGIHTMRIMATKRSIKCYIDNERVANIPKVDGFDPVGSMVATNPRKKAENPTLFRGFRFAEGGKTMRQQLEDDGKIVTHGILFDSGSDKIKGESFKTLKEIGRLFEDDPALRLSIEGHTDSDGSDESNQSLSQNRAEAVRNYLITTYSISAERLESKGWGESNPMETNDTPEGKANNRRVELIRI